MAPAAHSSARSAWLAGPALDLVLYSGISLWSAVAVLGLGRAIDPAALFFAFNVGFTLTHFAPTWIRAYADREERTHSRASLLLFPLGFAVAAFVTRGEPLVLAFVSYFWERYHALMQNYGFLRLYDARSGVKSSGRVEQALLFSSALCLMTFNMGLFTPFLAQLYRLGVPLAFGPGLLQGARLVTGSAVLVTALFWLQDLRRTAKEGGLPKAKLVFLGALFAGHLLMNTTTDVYLLSCHEKLYHSVQYVALTWQYNRRRDARAGTSKTGALFHLLSGPGALWRYLAALGGWTAAVFALDRFAGGGSSFATSAFTTLFAGLALTHYYFDSFLWQVRRAEVRANL